VFILFDILKGTCVYLCPASSPSFVVAAEALAMEGAPAETNLAGQPPTPAPSTPKTLVELSVDGQKQLDTVVEAAHDILLSLNRALCSPSFWVAPSLQPGHAAAEAGEAANGDEKGADSSAEGLAALDATRVRYKAATGALRATVAAIVKQTQVCDRDYWIFLLGLIECLSYQFTGMQRLSAGFVGGVVTPTNP